MGITSFAQNFEDVLLWRALQDVGEGTYVDIGAQHPVIDSVSKAFYDRGWRGVDVEPSAPYAELLRQQRPGNRIVQAVVSDSRGVVPFYEIPDTGLSTASAEIAAHHRESGWQFLEQRIASVTLDDIFELVPADTVHWMKIDVEGHEKQVLAGWRNADHRPWVIVIESTYPNTQQETHAEWEPLVFEKGYRLAFADGLNRYYVWELKPELLASFRYGPNIFDGFQLTENSGLVAALRQLHAAETAQAVAEVAELRAELARLSSVDRRSAERLSEGSREERGKAIADLADEVGKTQGRLAQQSAHLVQFERDVAHHLAALGMEHQKSIGQMQKAMEELAASFRADMEMLAERVKRVEHGGSARASRSDVEAATGTGGASKGKAPARTRAHKQ